MRCQRGVGVAGLERLQLPTPNTNTEATLILSSPTAIRPSRPITYTFPFGRPASYRSSCQNKQRLELAKSHALSRSRACSRVVCRILVVTVPIYGSTHQATSTSTSKPTYQSRDRRVVEWSPNRCRCQQASLVVLHLADHHDQETLRRLAHRNVQWNLR
jgi:hypothetical protein